MLASTRTSNSGVLTFVFVALLLGISPGCAVDPPITMAPDTEVTASTGSFSLTDTAFDAFSEYRIAPGDELDILFSVQTWRRESEFRIAPGDTVTVKFLNAPQFNETQKVRPDGTISLPFISSVVVSEKTVDGLTAELKRKYADVFRSPEILVTVPEFLAQIRELKSDLRTSARGLSRLVTVRPDGFTTFPMLGDIQVANKTLTEVSERLNRRYEAISPSLKVDLFLEKHASSVVYVLGSVNKPGAYPISRPLSVIEAITLAQGTDDTADLGKVVVMRRKNENMAGTLVNVNDMLTFNEQSRFLFISKDDIIYVPRRRLASQAQFMDELSRVLTFRGWGLGDININGQN